MWGHMLVWYAYRKRGYGPSRDTLGWHRDYYKNPFPHSQFCEGKKRHAGISLQSGPLCAYTLNLEGLVVRM